VDPAGGSHASREALSLHPRPGPLPDGEGEVRPLVSAVLRDLPAPTIRLFVLALALAAPLALGTFAPFFLGIAGAAAIALVAALLGDYAGATSPAPLEAERRHDPRLYLGVDNPIALVVRSRSRREVLVRVRDTPPALFRSSALFSAGPVGAASETVF